MPTRRRFLVLAGRALALLGLARWPVGAAPARGQERALSIHHATRNTPAGAVGVRIRRLLDRPERAHAHPGRERIPLAPPPREPALALAEALPRYTPASGFAPAPLPRPALDRLLRFTNGVTGESPAGTKLRAAPSAGALYAGEIYVVAERVEGLEPGLYAYAPLEDALVVLRRGRLLEEVAGSLEEPGRARGAAVAVLLTNVFARYRQRYANRGYRYALIDSGHLGENLRLVSTSAGLAERGALRFHDDRLNALLEVDGVEEAVCALHLVGARGQAPARLVRQPLVEAWRADRPVPDDADDDPERYHARTRLVPAPDGVGTRAESDSAPPDAEGAADALPLAGPASDMPVERAIELRRSTRSFLRDPVSPGDLAFVLDAAAGHPALRRAPGLELRLVVHRVAGLEPGLYRLAPGARALVPLRTERLDDALVDACLGQERAGQAAVGLAMVADIQGAAAARGDRAWRDLCVEAGAVAQRVYLAAESLGLTARNLAAFVDERLNPLVEVDGERRAVLHLTMLGAGD